MPTEPTPKRADLSWHSMTPARTDRTRSPAAISQKREYFKYPPETIGYFAPEVAKFGRLETVHWIAKARHWRAFLALLRAKSLGGGLIGWGGRIRTLRWWIEI